MHLRGKDFELRVIYPGGEKQTVLKGRWDFKWQMGYQLRRADAAAEGTRSSRFITHFDNSPATGSIRIRRRRSSGVRRTGTR